MKPKEIDNHAAAAANKEILRWLRLRNRAVSNTSPAMRHMREQRKAEAELRLGSIRAILLVKHMSDNK